MDEKNIIENRVEEEFFCTFCTRMATNAQGRWWRYTENHTLQILLRHHFFLVFSMEVIIFLQWELSWFSVTFRFWTKVTAQLKLILLWYARLARVVTTRVLPTRPLYFLFTSTLSPGLVFAPLTCSTIFRCTFRGQLLSLLNCKKVRKKAGLRS